MARVWPLLGLGCAGVVIELGWLVLTPLSFRMTHGAEYTQTLLQQHAALSGWLDAVLPLSTRLAPAVQQQSTYIDPQLNTLVAIFVLTSLAYLGAVVLLDRVVRVSRVAVALVVGFGLLFQLSLLLIPGFLTTDVFSYVMYGRIAFVYRANPYLVPPGAFPGDPVLPWIHPAWVMQPSVYGPLWTDLGWLMAKLGTSLDVVDQVFAYKLLLNGAQLANLALVWWLLGRLGPGRSSPRAHLVGFALFAWNPLVLFELAANAHNDGLMLTLLLLGLVPLAGQPRWLPGLLLVWLGTLVKYAGGLVAVFCAVAWLRSLDGIRRRVLAAGSLGLALVVLTAAIGWRWLEAPDALRPLLARAGGDFYGNSLVDLLGTSLANAGLTANLDQARVWAALLTRVPFGLYLAWEIRRVWRAAGQGSPEHTVHAVLQASVRGLLGLLLLVLTWVLTWYFTWPLALAVLLGWRCRLARVAVAFSLTCLPFIYLKHYWGDAMPDALAVLYVVPPLALAVPWAALRGPRWPSAVSAQPSVRGTVQPD